MAAIDVDGRNFQYWLPRIKKSIEEAVFVSIDCEFLGLPSALRGCTVSLFDTPSDRYRKLRDAVCRFPPCQLGLVCYQEGGNGVPYRADAFCITLFKSIPQREFSISTSAITFLAEHGFDFNKFALHGVNFCNRREIADLRSRITSGVFDVELLGADFGKRIRLIKMHILLEVDESDNLSLCQPPSCGYSATHLKRPLVINLYRGEVEEDETGDAIWDHPLSPLEEAVMLHTLSEEYPDLEFEVGCERTLLYVEKRPLIYGTAPVLNQEQVMENLLTEISGVSEIFHHLSVWKPPIVGHNCLLDLMYIYNCFENDLPESYTVWKKKFHDKFPVVFDTKFFAELLEKTLCTHGLTEISLSGLVDFFRQRPLTGMLPLSVSLEINGVKTHSIFQVEGSYHNAAYDAAVTGAVFIALAYVYVTTRCSNVEDLPWPLRRLLIACREEVANKIPICMIDAKCCNMEGDDSLGRRPGIVEVRVRAQSRLSSTSDNFLRRLREALIGFPEIPQKDFRSIRNELFQLFGAFRVDVRLGAKRRSVEIATNSASTYARVCSFIDANDRYCFVDDKPRTFEQRLCSSEIGKRAISKDSSIAFPTITVRLLLSLALSSLAVAAFRFLRVKLFFASNSFLK